MTIHGYCTDVDGRDFLDEDEKEADVDDAGDDGDETALFVFFLAGVSP